MISRRKALLGSAASLLWPLSAQSYWHSVDSNNNNACVVEGCGPPNPPTTQFPLALSANGRYLIDAQNNPFLMVADSAQSACIQSVADMQTYVNARKAEGFNTIHFGLIADQYVGNPVQSPFNTLDNINPFTGAIFGTLNAAYLTRQDALIKVIGDANMVALINPWQTGGAPGFDSNMAAAFGSASTGNVQTFGTTIAQRYANRPYVCWFFGNDYNPNAYGDNDAKMLAFIQTFIDNAPTQLRFGQLCNVASQDNVTTLPGISNRFLPPIMNSSGAYCYSVPYEGCIRAYNNSGVTFAGNAGVNATPPVPVMLLESEYEWDNLNGTPGTPTTLRKIAWWSYLSGAVSYISGSYFTAYHDWNSTTTAPTAGYITTPRVWVNNLNSPNAQYLGILKNFLTSVAWQNLIPDQTHVVGASASGAATLTPINTGQMNNNGYVTLAATADGSLAVAFFPLGGSLTVNLGTFSTSVIAKWLDPTNGAVTTIGTFGNAGSHTFTTPGNNSAAAPDFVLFIQAAFNDGLANAPAGPAQYPTLFTAGNGTTTNAYQGFNGTAYPTRPAWNVAGVDYAVGVPKNVTMANSGSTIQFNYTAHGFTATTAITIRPMTGCTLPSALTAGTVYFVIAAGLTANSFQISATSGGAALTADVTGMVGASFFALRDVGVNCAAIIAFYGGGNLSFPGNPNTLNINHSGTAGTQYVISGWDFAAHGGYAVAMGGNFQTVQNCYFAAGSNYNTSGNAFNTGSFSLINMGGLVGSNVGNGCIAQYNIVDGAGAILQQIGIGVVWCGVNNGTGTYQYNWIKNAYSENVVTLGTATGSTGADFVFRYNVIQEAGLGSGQPLPFEAHGDWVQNVNGDSQGVTGKITSMRWEFNTWMQTLRYDTNNTWPPFFASAPATQGVTTPSNVTGTGGGALVETFNNNVCIAPLHAFVNWDLFIDRTNLNGTAQVMNNYVDISCINNVGVHGGFFNSQFQGGSQGPFNNTPTFTGNINLTSGALITSFP